MAHGLALGVDQLSDRAPPVDHGLARVDVLRPARTLVIRCAQLRVQVGERVHGHVLVRPRVLVLALLRVRVQARGRGLHHAPEYAQDLVRGRHGVLVRELDQLPVVLKQTFGRPLFLR